MKWLTLFCTRTLNLCSLRRQWALKINSFLKITATNLRHEQAITETENRSWNWKNDKNYRILTVENRWALRFVIYRYTKYFPFIFQRDKAWWSVFILLANIFKKEKLFGFKSPVKREMGGKGISLSRFAIIPHYRGITGPWMTTPGVRECWKETSPWWPVSWTDVTGIRGKSIF